MNEFLEFVKKLFGLSEEQVKKAEETLKIVEEPKNTDDISETIKSETKEETDTTTEKEDLTKTQSLDVGTQSLDVNNNEGDEENMSMNALQEELKAVKEMLEASKAETLAEKRKNKIQNVKDCVDYDILTTLLEGVEDKDFDKKIAELQKEKSYLFKSKETDGFNPATPQAAVGDVEAAFYAKDPDLKG